MATFYDLAASGVARYNSAALENAAQPTAVQSILFGFDGRNTDSTAKFIMAFDSAAAVANGTLPIIIIGAPPAGTGANVAAGSFSYSAPLYGIRFQYGIYVAVSTTDSTLTLDTASKTLLHIQYAHEDGSANL